VQSKPIYILGTGLSHDGSTCLMKNGEIVVAIEKERLSRVKHDGGNDTLTVKYCLDAESISEKDLSMVVQVANFEKDEIQIDRYIGQRHFTKALAAPVHTISHHMAHAYSAVGSSPFETCNVMVIDGAGSPYQHCEDIEGAKIPAQQHPFNMRMYCEKDSFYFFDGQELRPIFKDFSEMLFHGKDSSVRLSTNYNSIGGLYSAASSYCFGNMDDAGKLMGLAPYGSLTSKPEIFKFQNGCVEIIYKNLEAVFTDAAKSYDHFKSNFQHYADIAKWVQNETERTILSVFSERLKLHPHPNMAYAGGVALNAVANARLLRETGIKNLYMQPAAGDNGLAIGCAYYGWLHVLKNKKVRHSGSPFLGKRYAEDEIQYAIRMYEVEHGVTIRRNRPSNCAAEMASLLNAGNVLAWLQGGAEFGPRALGHRSILADPRKTDIRSHINLKIKFREDFRPFAPAVKKENVHTYFEDGFESPYMILIDRIRKEWKDKVPGIVHCDGTCRVQTVTPEWNAEFYELLDAFEKISGVGILLNTSFNKKGMPIVETPKEALELFFNTAIDILVLENIIIQK